MVLLFLLKNQYVMGYKNNNNELKMLKLFFTLLRLVIAVRIEY